MWLNDDEDPCGHKQDANTADNNTFIQQNHPALGTNVPSASL